MRNRNQDQSAQRDEPWLGADVEQGARRCALLTNTRGAVMLEYTIICGTVAIAGSLGLLAVGISVVRNFEFVRSLILCAVP